MADELTVTAGLAYSKSGVALQMSGTDKVTVSANFVMRIIYTVTTAGGALPLGGIAAPGYFLMQNRDATNFILISNSGDPSLIKLKAGEYALLRFNTGVTPYAIADTGDVDVEYFLLSD